MHVARLGIMMRCIHEHPELYILKETPNVLFVNVMHAVQGGKIIVYSQKY